MWVLPRVPAIAVATCMEVERTVRKSLSLLSQMLLLFCACAAAQSSAAPASTAALTATDPTAAKARQLLDQMIAALGGDAWLTYKTFEQQGRTYNFFHGKPSAEGAIFWRFYAYPDKERRELT